MTPASMRIYGPSASAPKVTNEVARCRVCGAQWQVKSDKREDAQGCAFCGAPAEAITIESEAPDFGGAIIT